MDLKDLIDALTESSTLIDHESVAGIISSVQCMSDSYKKKQLLGISPQAEALTFQNLSFYSKNLKGSLDKESQIVYASGILNEMLRTTAFLTGFVGPSIADFVVYQALSKSPMFTKMASTTLTKDYPSLVRWFDCMQHSPFLARMKFSKIHFTLPEAFAVKDASLGSEKKKENKKGSVAGKRSGGNAEGPGKKGEVKDKKPKTKDKKETPKKVDVQPEITKLDIRVGLIKSIEKHPEKDKLYCEEIDLNEEGGCRTIASGLVEFYPDCSGKN